jgi:hypothetical protein
MADVEKHDMEEAKIPAVADIAEVNTGTVEEVKRARDLQNRSVVLRKLRAGEEWLDAKLGIELQGVDRIPDELKEPPSIWNVSQPHVTKPLFSGGTDALVDIFPVVVSQRPRRRRALGHPWSRIRPIPQSDGRRKYHRHIARIAVHRIQRYTRS